jgi:hypothetical protein
MILRAAAVLLLGTAVVVPATSRHCYSIWNYPQPQKCGVASFPRVAHRPLATAKADNRSYYVEVTSPVASPVAVLPVLPVLDPVREFPPKSPLRAAPEPDDRTPDQIRESEQHDQAVAQHKDELNDQLRLLEELRHK